MHDINIRLLQKLTEIVISFNAVIHLGKGAVKPLSVYITQGNEPSLPSQMIAVADPATAYDCFREFIGRCNIA